MAATTWATKAHKKSGRLVWDEQDLKVLHARIKARGEDVPVMDVCKSISKEMKGIKGITPHKIYQRAYFYDHSLPASERFADTTRSRRSIKGAQVRAGTAKVEAPKAPVKQKRRKRVAKPAPVVVSPLELDPLTVVSNMLDQLRAEKASAEARAAAAEARAEKLATKLDRVHKLSA